MMVTRKGSLQSTSASALAPVEGKYEIVAKISEGGMGDVYQVRHRLLDELRVVKVLRPRHADSEELRQRFIAEARNANRMRHPNVVEIHDFTVNDDGTGILVMAFIDGIDLRDMIRGGLPSLPLLLEIARQTLRALGYLHRLGFVHRDVSPDNLMLTLDTDGLPLVKLIDLGIAKDRRAAIDLTEAGAFLGKFRYASPEHFSSEDSAEIGPVSDLYALGVVLFELATGVHPIKGDDAAALIAGHLFRSPRDFESVDPERRVLPELRETLSRCLEKAPTDRFASATDMRQALEPLFEAFPVDDAVAEETRRRIRSRSAKASVDGVIEPAFRPGSTQQRLDASFELESTRPAIDDPLDRFVARGCAYAADGDFVHAAEAFTHALALCPESVPIRMLLEEAEAQIPPGDGPEAGTDVDTEADPNAPT